MQIEAGLNYSLCIVGKHVSGLCECGSLEIVRHVFLECRRYRGESRGERKVFFNKLAGIGVEVFSV